MNIIITGATGAIGHHLAYYYGKNNNLILQYYSNDILAHKIKSDLEKYNNKIILLKHDLINDYGSFIEIVNSYFKSHVLINNFSTFRHNNFNNFTEEELKEDLITNAISPLMITKEFAKIYSEGIVINMLDIKALMRDEDHFTYSLSKKLFTDITKECAFYLPPLRVNGIALGLNETDQFLSPDKLPLKEKVTISDITTTIDYLINNNHITGEIINLDSGRHLREG